MELVIKLLVAGGVMGVLDYIWLGFVAKKLYYSSMGNLLLEKPNMTAALLFYGLYVVGVVVFVVNPAVEQGSFIRAVGYGALFGLVAYGTYDLTNLAVLKGYSSSIAVIDLIWGMVITAVTASAAFLVVQHWFH